MKSNRKKWLCLFALTAFLLTPVFRAGSQSAYLDNGTNGTGLTVSSFWNSERFESVGFSAAYSISGILDLGMGMDLLFDRLNDYNAREINGYILYNVIVLKQDRYMPLSMQIAGSYGLTTISSEFLDTNELLKRGWGLTIGARLFSDIMLTSGFGLRFGAFFTYRWYRFTTEQETAAVVDSGWPRTEDVDSLYYGGLFSLLFKTSQSGPVISTTFEGMIDPGLNFRLGPKVNITVPLSHS